MSRSSDACSIIDESASLLACLGQDLLRVWPLPVEQPRWEDGFEDSVAHLEP